MAEEKVRLMKLIEHWAEHNDEHSERFKESAVKAEDMDLTGVADQLNYAYTEAVEVSKHLRNALAMFR